MLLGDLIARFHDETIAEQAVLAIGDIVLLASVREAAGVAGLGTGEYMAAVTRRYAAEASDEEWLSLMAALGRGDDPAGTALGRMVRWSLGRPQRATEPDWMD